MIISFWVPGIPQPGGSKRPFMNRTTGRIIVTEDNPKSKNWRTSVAQIAAETVGEPLSGPLSVTFEFVMPRPSGHYGSGRNDGRLKSGAPVWHTVRPDCSKLIRSTEDAMKGIAWRDDSQISLQRGSKRYGDRIGALIKIETLEDESLLPMPAPERQKSKPAEENLFA